MSYPSQPEHWYTAVGSPKQKYKFLVEFDSTSIIGKTFNQKQYKYLIKSITKPKPTMATAEANDQETRNWFGNTPDPTKRLQGSVSWSPITIKFVNQIVRTVNKGEETYSTTSYEPPDDEYPPSKPSGPGMAVPDLDHFFSRIVEDMDSSFFGGSAPKEFEFPKIQYSRREDAIAAYINSLSIADRIGASKKSLADVLDAAQLAGFEYSDPEDYSSFKEDASTLLRGIDCKSSMDSFMKASCVFVKFFGFIKIYDLITNLPNNPNKDLNLSAATTFANGYWTLRNPFIKSIDFGSYDYSADDLVEYSIEIGYESARYVTLHYGAIATE